MRSLARQFWGEDLIWAISAILYQIVHSFYRVFWLMRLGQKIKDFVLGCTRLTRSWGGSERAAIAVFTRKQSVIPYQTLYWTRLVQHWRKKRLKLGPWLEIRPQLPIHFSRSNQIWTSLSNLKRAGLVGCARFFFASAQTGTNFAAHAVFPTVVYAPKTSKLCYLPAVFPTSVFHWTDWTDSTHQETSEQCLKSGGGELAAHERSNIGCEGGGKGLQKYCSLIWQEGAKE